MLLKWVNQFDQAFGEEAEDKVRPDRYKKEVGEKLVEKTKKLHEEIKKLRGKL